MQSLLLTRREADCMSVCIYLAYTKASYIVNAFVENVYTKYVKALPVIQ